MDFKSSQRQLDTTVCTVTYTDKFLSTTGGNTISIQDLVPPDAVFCLHVLVFFVIRNGIKWSSVGYKNYNKTTLHRSTYLIYYTQLLIFRHNPLRRPWFCPIVAHFLIIRKRKWLFVNGYDYKWPSCIGKDYLNSSHVWKKCITPLGDYVAKKNDSSLE